MTRKQRHVAARRSISLTKRNNQKRNKLIKKGKIKPSFKPKYVPKSAALKSKREIFKDFGNKKDDDMAEDDDEMYQQLADSIDAEDVAFIREHATATGTEFNEFETQAIQRINWEQGQKTATKALLPIKTKREGIITKTMELVKEDEEEEENDDERRSMNAETPTIEESAPVVVSVVQLMSERKELLKQRRSEIGILCCSFLESPSERIQLLEKMLKIMAQDSLNESRTTLVMLESTSILELLKDVLPNYRISHPGHAEEIKLKKETYKLQRFENGLLACTKSYLVKLEKYLVGGLGKHAKLSSLKSKLALHALRCMCDLLIARPEFNFAQNVVQLVVPYLNHISSSEARDIVCSSLEILFRDDVKGELSCCIVRRINHIIKIRLGRKLIHPIVLKPLLSLRILQEHSSIEEEHQRKLKNVTAKVRSKRLKGNIIKIVSKNEKKRRKKLAKLENELLEAKAEESVQTKTKNFTEITNLIFVIYFRILKCTFGHCVRSLLKPVLAGVSKFGHSISLDFFHDLMKLFSDLIQSEGLSHQDIIHCIKAVFTILSGPGNLLNVDPSRFYTSLYSNMLRISPYYVDNELLYLLLTTLSEALIKRKKRISFNCVTSFTKRLATLSCHLPSDATFSCLKTLRDIFVAHPKSADVLLNNEEIGSGRFNPAESVSPEDVQANNAVLWELYILNSHFCASIRDIASNLLMNRTSVDNFSSIVINEDMMGEQSRRCCIRDAELVKPQNKKRKTLSFSSSAQIRQWEQFVFD